MPGSDDHRSVVAHSESDAQELAKQARITYTREFLFSLANVDAGKQLPSGIEPSILCELDSTCRVTSQQSCHSDNKTCSERWHNNLHKGPLQKSECDGLLGNGACPGVYVRISGDSAPKFQDNSRHLLLHKSKEPFRPRHLYKAENRSGRNPWDLCNDETFGSSECLSQREEEEEKVRRDLIDAVTEGSNKAIQAEQKNNPNEHDENSKSVMLLDESADEKTPTCGISCNEGSESIAHGVSKDLTQERACDTGSEEGLQSSDASSFIQQSSVGWSARDDVPEPCKLPFPNVDNYVFPSTTNEYGLIEIDCEDILSSISADDFVERIISDVEIDPAFKLNSVNYLDEKDGWPIELLLPDEDSLITVDDFKFMADKENNTMLTPEGNSVKEDGVSSTPVDTCRKLMGDEKSTQLSSAGSTSFCNSVDVVAGLGTSYNSQELHASKSPARHRVRTIPSRPGSTSIRPFSSQPAQAHMNSHMKPLTPNKPSGPYSHPSPTNSLPPSTFRHSHAKPHQQLQQTLIPGGILPHQLIGSQMTPPPSDQSCYVQQLSPVPLNYQSPNHGCFGVPTPGYQVYGSTNDLDLAFSHSSRWK